MSHFSISEIAEFRCGTYAAACCLSKEQLLLLIRVFHPSVNPDKVATFHSIVCSCAINQRPPSPNTSKPKPNITRRVTSTSTRGVIKPASSAAAAPAASRSPSQERIFLNMYESSEPIDDPEFFKWQRAYVSTHPGAVYKHLPPVTAEDAATLRVAQPDITLSDVSDTADALLESAENPYCAAAIFAARRLGGEALAKRVAEACERGEDYSSMMGG